VSELEAKEALRDLERERELSGKAEESAVAGGVKWEGSIYF
jgi:hypothetical protein